MSLVRHSAWAAGAAIVLAGSRFAFGAIVARRLSVTEFGRYSYGQWLVDFTFLVCALGTGGALARYLAEFRHDPGLLAAFAKRVRPFALALPCVAACIAPAAAWAAGLYLPPRVLAMLGLLTLANGTWALQTAALTGLQRFDLIFFANATAGLILVGGALVMPFGDHDLTRVFGLTSLAAGCAVAIGYPATRRLADGVPTAVTPTRWRGIRSYAINIWLTALLSSLVWSRGEMPVVKAHVGDQGVAHYAAALGLFGGVSMAVMLATSGIAPQLTRLWGEGSHTQALSLARKIMDLQLLLCGAAAVQLACFSPELMQLAFGMEYRAQSDTLVFLSFGLLALAASCLNHLLQIATNAKFTRDSTLAGLVVLLGSAVLLVKTVGLSGAAVSRAGTMVGMMALSLSVGHIRWGAAAYSLWNVLSALLVLTTCAVVRLSAPDLSLPWRIGLAVTASALLALAIRDADGRLQARELLERLRYGGRPAQIAVGKVDRA